MYKSSPVIFTLIFESPFEQATKCQDKNMNAKNKRFVMTSIFILNQI